MTNNTLFWLFSTIAQTWGALLGVGGLLVVFKLEALRNARWNIIKDISPIVLPVLKSDKPRAKDVLEEFREVIGKSDGRYDLKSGSIIEISGPKSKILKKIEKGFQGITGLYCENFGLRLAELEEVFDSTGEIKKTFLWFLVFSLATIVSSVFLLIFCEILHKWVLAWLLTVFGVFVLICLSLWSMYNLVRAIIQGEKE